jgi:hypothetical protein
MNRLWSKWVELAEGLLALVYAVGLFVRELVHVLFTGLLALALDFLERISPDDD